MIPSNVQSSLSAALEHHHAGRLLKAEKTYRAILAQHPDHADALHLLGMLLHGRGQQTEAQRLIRRAISIHPAQAVFHSNLGIVLAANGDFAAAIAAYRIADSLNPASPENLNNLGVALHRSGALADATDCFNRAFLHRPDYADAQTNLLACLNLTPQTAAAYHTLGDLLHQADRSVDAIEFYRQAIALDPWSAQTHNNLGNALAAIGEPAQALQCYQRALQLAPDFPQARNNLANALKELDRLAEALVAYRQAVQLQPDAPEPLCNLGNALRDAGQWESAMTCYRQALTLQPDHPVTHNNLANAWCEHGDFAAAISEYERALALKPDYADAINNLGTALEETGQRDPAMQCYRRAAELTLKAVSPPWNIALLQLLQGDYRNGWKGYENRWRQKKQCKTWRNFPQPMLKSLTELKNARILLHTEQGFGDAIQFCRYATLVARQGATVFLECPPELVRLFSTLPGVSALIARGDPLPDFDLHCPLMSLPMLFDTQLHTVPAPVSYLSADPVDLARWKPRFTDKPDALRVGLVWAGQATHQKDRQRSLSLSAFSALGDIPGPVFYSLQLGNAATQAESPPAGMRLIDWTTELHDFADTAALISQLDLVITVDTAVCHLAAALGKPVWALLAFQPDWRWLLDRDDSPWYPTIRLYRQPEPENWDSPLTRIAADLSIQSRRNCHG